MLCRAGVLHTAIGVFVIRKRTASDINRGSEQIRGDAPWRDAVNSEKVRSIRGLRDTTIIANVRRGGRTGWANRVGTGAKSQDVLILMQSTPCAWRPSHAAVGRDRQSLKSQIDYPLVLRIHSNDLVIVALASRAQASGLR